MEYVLSNAAVARSFTEYLSGTFGVEDPNSWRVEIHGFADGYNMLDFSAVALILFLTLCLCHRYILHEFCWPVSIGLLTLYFVTKIKLNE